MEHQYRHGCEGILMMRTTKDNRYLELTEDQTKDIVNGEGKIIEPIKGLWKFDVQRDKGTIYSGQVFFMGNITGDNTIVGN